MITDLIIKLILSLALGALIGIERERRGAGELVEGMRTFMLLSFFATLSAYFYQFFNTILIVIVAFVIVGILTIFGYISKTRKKHFGLTTEIAFLLTFIIGLIVFFDSYPYIFSIATGLILTFILASKGRMHNFAHHLKEKEVWDAIFFAILVFVILPIVPNTTYFNFFNPFLVWLSIVLVLAMSFAGYIAMRIFGVRKGIALTGAFGGLVSSTSVTVAMSEETKKFPKIFNTAAFAITLASSTMFLRILAVDFFINTDVAMKIMMPMVVLAAVGYIVSFIIFKNSKSEPKVNLGSPLAFKPAAAFGIFFIVVFIVSRLVGTYVGDAGILLFAFIAGLVEVDAINISLATLAISTITPTLAIHGIILAAVANTISKWFLSRTLGTSDLVKDVGKVFIFLIALGIGLLFFTVI
jgi:uncharacterized membrane protein (DUF4010 family)